MLGSGKVSADESLRTARGVMPSPWICDLPPFLRTIVIWIYVDLLLLEDDFITQLRKLVISVAVTISGCAWFVFVYNNLTIPTDDLSAGAFAARISPAALASLFALCYVLQRCEVLTAAANSALFIFGIANVLIFAALSFPDYPTSESMILVAFIGQVLRVPGLKFLFPMLACYFVISAVNQSAFSRGAPEVTLWAIPGAVMRSFTTRMILEMVSLSAAGLVCAVLHIQLLESDKLTMQAQAASELAVTVAECLGRYDTNEAAETIKEFAQDREMTEGLVPALTVLVDNLNRYRPHLPNWLLPNTTSAGEDDASDKDTALTPPRESPRRRVATSDSASVHSASSRASAHREQQPQQGTQAWLHGGQPFSSSVTLAFIAYRGLGDDSVSAQAAGNAVADFVDTVHRLANQSSAAVHSFVGDTVVLSWNAASRALQHEAKAARMVARLMHREGSDALLSPSVAHLAMRPTASIAAARELPLWRLRGSVMTGKMRVQMAGGGADGKQQQALTVSAPWLDGRWGALDLAARNAERRSFGSEDGGSNHCVLMDYATKAGSAFAVHTRAACAVNLDGPTLHTPSRLAVYELLGEVRDHDGDAEWMYVLEQQLKKGEAESLIDALDAWARGEDARAWTALCSHTDSSCGTAAARRELHTAITEAAALHRPPS